MWHYLSNNESTGPVSTADMIALVSQRQIANDTMIWREGMEEWAPLDQTDLLDHFDKLSAPPPLPRAVEKPKPLEFDLAKELPSPTARKAAQEEAALHDLVGTVAKGANWFYWIAGLSVLNLALTAMKAPLSMALGLGVTDLVYAFSISDVAGTETPPPSAAVVVIDLILCGLLGLCGWLSTQGNRRVFIIGTVGIALDSLLFLFPFFSIIALVVHGYALFSMFQGISALGTIKKILAEHNAVAA